MIESAFITVLKPSGKEMFYTVGVFLPKSITALEDWFPSDTL